MDPTEEAKAVERRAAELKIKMADVLKRGGVHRATWDRWKSGAFEPQMKKWRRVTAALAQLEAEAAPDSEFTDATSEPAEAAQ
jgi:predicted transcriptional regulator